MTIRTQAALQSQIDTLLANNTAGGISPSDMRSVLTDVNDTHFNITPASSTDWAYASLSAAEASGDNWVDGDEIILDSNLRFIYKSVLAVVGHSGLIHKEPYGSGNGTLNSVTLNGSEIANSDPDAWTSGWTDVSTGVKTTDYDFDTSASLSRIRALTSSGIGRIKTSQSVTSVDLECFRIIHDISGTATSSTSGYLLTAQLQAYKDGVDRNWITLEGTTDSESTNWRVNHTNFSTFATTSQSRTSASRVWMYVKNGQWAVWFNEDTSPAASGTVPREAADSGAEELIANQASNGAAAGVSNLLLGSDVFGIMVTA